MLVSEIEIIENHHVRILGYEIEIENPNGGSGLVKPLLQIQAFSQGTGNLDLSRNFWFLHPAHPTESHKCNY